jgi:hypothetical protein
MRCFHVMIVGISVPIIICTAFVPLTQSQMTLRVPAFAGQYVSYVMISIKQDVYDTVVPCSA